MNYEDVFSHSGEGGGVAATRYIQPNAEQAYDSHCGTRERKQWLIPPRPTSLFFYSQSGGKCSKVVIFLSLALTLITSTCTLGGLLLADCGVLAWCGWNPTGLGWHRGPGYRAGSHPGGWGGGAGRPGLATHGTPGRNGKKYGLLPKSQPGFHTTVSECVSVCVSVLKCVCVWVW